MVKSTKQLYFALSTFEKGLRKHLEKSRGNWRVNAVNGTERYLNEGLRDRAISRDLDIGIDIPIKGFEDKKVYVWIDAVLGYLTVSEKWGKENNKNVSDYWNSSSISYYIHGKDNIPFHTIILPALLRGTGPERNPDKVISSECVTLEGKKISTSNNWAVWIPDIVERYNSDLIRYFFIANGPEKRDIDFSWREFINKNNGELLGAYGNLVNRTLVFAKKYFNSNVPKGKVEESIKAYIEELYKSIGERIEEGNLKTAIEKIFTFIRSINKYFDEETPWITIKEENEKCGNTIYNCLYAIINIANILNPFLPESSAKIKSWFSYEENAWREIELKSGVNIGEFHILFERLDKRLIDEELNKLEW